MVWLFRVRENEGATFRCRVRRIVEPKLMEHYGIFARGLYLAYSAGVR